jgi:hypothetical protein
MGERNPYMHPLLGYTTDGNQQDGPGAPGHWLQQKAQLRNGGRKIESTIPKYYAEHAGIDRDDPPEVDIYLDPHTGLVIFDLENHFNGGETNG